MNDKTREQTRIEFEVKHPTPAGAMWNERAKCYVSTVGYAPNYHPALHNIRLEAWKSAHEVYAPKWLPIESAPKDGSHVIVCKIGLTHDVQGETLGSERWEEVVFNSDPTIESVWWASSARFKDGKWRWSNETLVEPTHWMPLPKQEQPTMSDKAIEDFNAWLSRNEYPIRDSQLNTIVKGCMLEAWQAAKEMYAPKEIPSVLFDGFAVYSALSDKARQRTSAENVSDVLDAVVRILKQEKDE